MLSMLAAHFPLIPGHGTPDPHPRPHPRFAGDRGWGSHPRFAGDPSRGSTPIPIPDLPEIGDHPHPRFPSGVPPPAGLWPRAAARGVLPGACGTPLMPKKRASLESGRSRLDFFGLGILAAASTTKQAPPSLDLGPDSAVATVSPSTYQHSAALACSGQSTSHLASSGSGSSRRNASSGTGGSRSRRQSDSKSAIFIEAFAAQHRIAETSARFSGLRRNVFPLQDSGASRL
jgi:hypothetical protein